MKQTEIEAVLATSGFSQSRRTRKVVEYVSKTNGKVVYLESGVGLPSTTKVVVHPNESPETYTGAVDILVPATGLFHHHSNMSSFPRRKHTGADPISYGVPITLSSLAGVREFARRFNYSAQGSDAASLAPGMEPPIGPGVVEGVGGVASNSKRVIFGVLALLALAVAFWFVLKP